MNNFRDWWIANKQMIEKLARLWFLPAKWKNIIKAIIAGVDAAINQSSTAFTNVARPDVENLS